MRIRGETLALQAKWRRVQQRLPSNRPGTIRTAAVSSATSPASSSSSGAEEPAGADIGEATMGVVVAREPDGPRVVVQRRRQKSVERAPSSETTATVTVSLGGAHALGDDVGGAVTSPAVAAKGLRPADADDCEPDTPEPPRKKGRSAATASPTADTAAATGAFAPATAALKGGICGPTADQTPEAPRTGCLPPATVLDAVLPQRADGEASAPQQGVVSATYVEATGALTEQFNGVIPASNTLLPVQETIQAVIDHAKPTQVAGDRVIPVRVTPAKATPSRVTPSTADVVTAVPETVTVRRIRAPRRRKS